MIDFRDLAMHILLDMFLQTELGNDLSLVISVCAWLYPWWLCDCRSHFPHLTIWTSIKLVILEMYSSTRDVGLWEFLKSFSPLNFINEYVHFTCCLEGLSRPHEVIKPHSHDLKKAENHNIALIIFPEYEFMAGDRYLALDMRSSMRKGLTEVWMDLVPAQSSSTLHRPGGLEQIRDRTPH